MSNELEIDLTGYDSDWRNYYWRYRNGGKPYWALADIDEARRAVKESGLTRNCGKVDKILINVPARVQEIRQDFIMHLLGPAARKLTPPVLESKLYLSVNGRELAVSKTLDGMGQEIRSYLSKEISRIAERAKKKEAKKPENVVWGEPTGLFVPDINTKLRLVLPWSFTIHRESRNQKFLAWIMEDPNFSGWSHYRHPEKVNDWPVQMLQGSIIIVDRVYIRKGAGYEDFSSLTFRLQKGSEVVFNGNTLTAKGNHRFWAKLRDVNKIVAEVDLNSLPGQEKEGIARKD
jgi:hypothetical protein